MAFVDKAQDNKFRGQLQAGEMPGESSRLIRSSCPRKIRYVLQIITSPQLEYMQCSLTGQSHASS